MNSFLLNRAQGSIEPWQFHKAQTSRLIQLLEPSPEIRFSSRKSISTDEHLASQADDHELLAHKAGVNVLAIDQNHGR